MRHLRHLALFLVLVCSSSGIVDAAPRGGASTPPRLLSLSPDEAGKLPPEVLRHLKEAEKAFIKASYHLHLAEEIMPDLNARMSDLGEERPPLLPTPPVKGLRQGPSMKRFGGQEGPSLGLTRGATRSGRSFFGFGQKKGEKKDDQEAQKKGRRKEIPKGDEKLADEQRRKMDANYRRGREGSTVFGKVLGGIRKLTGKLLPKGMDKLVAPGAEMVHEAADKVGKKVSAPKDGMAIINGELRCWNKKTKRWESF